MAEEKIVLYDSDEAATFRAGVSGWVSRRGHFYGDNEHLARYDGCTHKKCEGGCGSVIRRETFTHCDRCRASRSDERFLALPSEPYTGQVVALLDGEEFFFDEDSLRDYVSDREIAADSLRLVKCEPQYAEEVDPEEVYEDLLSEDGYLPYYVIEAFAVLNATLREKKGLTPICWMPVDVRVVLPEGFAEEAER